MTIVRNVKVGLLALALATGTAAAQEQSAASAPQLIYVTPSGQTLRVDSSTPSPWRRPTVAGVQTDDGQGVIVPEARGTFVVAHPVRGFRPAWTDGRLNPHRGPRTLQGDLQSETVLTNETPREQRRFVRVLR